MKQVDACRAAGIALSSESDLTGDLKETRDKGRDLLFQQMDAIKHNEVAQLDAARAQTLAARTRKSAAAGRVGAAYENAGVQSGTQINNVMDRVRALALLTSEITGLKEQSDIATQKGELEAGIAELTARSGASVRRKFRSYDMWRAKAMLESARRMAVAARRAIESRFVLNLSDVTASQTFVEAPSTWVDEIFDADLNAPSVVGLSTAPGGVDGAVYPNRIQDYVENLERFVQGYAISYPTSVASPDTEVISLPGPNSQVTLDLAQGGVTTGISADSQGWTFFCPETSLWYPNPSAAVVAGSSSNTAEKGVASPLTLETLCQGLPPTLARYNFNLDPWGRLNSFISSPPFVQRYNVRWRRLSVNLVGSGIHDCSNAVSKEDCYSTSFLRYDLEHRGPSWLTNSDENWRSVTMPAAFVESGKALATEEWIDPVAKGWALPQVAAVARSEFQGRPVAGTYSLTIQLGPEVNLDRIERVQVLGETDYWTHQGDERGIHEISGARRDGATWSPKTLPALVSWFSPLRGYELDASSGTQTLYDQVLSTTVATQATPTLRPIRATDSGKVWLKFDADDVLTVPDVAAFGSTRKATYAMWLRFDSLSGTQDVVSQSGRIAVRRAADQLVWAVNTGIEVQVAPRLDTNWHFWSFEFDGSGTTDQARARIYRDGEEVATAFVGTVPPLLVDSTQSLTMMVSNGRLGSLYMLNDVLSYGDRVQLMASESPVSPWSPRQEDSLVGWWSPSKDYRLETDGTVSVVGDMGAFNNDAVQNGPTARPKRVIESGAPSFAFDGTQKYMSVASSTSLNWTNKGTYAFWGRSDDPTQDRILFEQGIYAGSGERFAIRYAGLSALSSVVIVTVCQSHTVCADGSVSIVSDRAWHFYVVQFDGTGTTNADRLKLFIDGVPKTLGFSGTGPVPAAMVASPSPLMIGDERSTGFNGRIGSVYEFNNVLDDTKRSLLMEYEAPYSKAVPMSALQVWMDPTMGLTKVGTTTQISSWANQGLFGSSLTASGTVSVNNVIGGQSSIYFPGGASFLTSGTMTGLIPSASDTTVIIVAKPESATPASASRVLMDLQPTTTATSQGLGLFHNNGQMVFRALSGTGDAKVNYGDFTVAHILVGRHVASKRQIYVDGKLGAESTVPVSHLGANNLRLGGFFQATPYDFQGEIGDALVWPRALSNAEINRVTQYLSGKYQIPVTAIP